MVGGHQMRRKGQSLEFRDFRAYQPGDDVRHIDWRASARYGAQSDRLVREFVAEEQLTLVISIDVSSTMHLPQPLSKLQTACWLAEAMAVIALRSGDRVVLHRLTGQGGESFVTLRGRSATGRIRPALQQLIQTPDDETCHLGPLERLLPPTAAWVILSDFYRPPDQLQRLAAAVARAQAGWRWVISLDLDAWPCEQAILGLGARRIDGPGADGDLFEIDLDGLDGVAHQIRQHKDHFIQRAGRTAHDLIHWSWPQQSEFEADSFFRSAFQDDPILQRLFMRESA